MITAPLSITRVGRHCRAVERTSPQTGQAALVARNGSGIYSALKPGLRAFTMAIHFKPRDRYRLALFAIYLVWWLALAIAPWYREDWLLENVLVFVMVPFVVLLHRRLSDTAVSALFVFLVLHAIGAHYTYAQVPYDAWSETLFGRSISSLLGFERNHFDRLVHFLYGLLITPTAIELIDSRVTQRGAWRYLVPFTFMAAHAAFYEVAEWLAATWFGGDLGVAYLGTQGDVWDAQKDSALAIVGALIAVVWLRIGDDSSARH